MKKSKRFLQVPELLVGFDTETTGLDTMNDRAISYGFSVFHFAKEIATEHFFVVPDRPIAPGAQRVHKISMERLVEMRDEGEAHSLEAGLARATALLKQYHDQGAFFVGSNLSRFDLEMFRRSSESVLGTSLLDAGLDLSLLRVIDVVEHDLAIEPRNETRPRRGLSHLCSFYDVTQGGHDALGDARAAVEVFIEQVIRNNAGQMFLNLEVPAFHASHE